MTKQKRHIQLKSGIVYKELQEYSLYINVVRVSNSGDEQEFSIVLSVGSTPVEAGIHALNHGDKVVFSQPIYELLEKAAGYEND